MFTALSRIAATAALAASLITAAPAHADVPPTVTCRYVFTAWHGGFVADLYMTNNGPLIDGWTVHWTFSTPTQATSVWLARLHQDNPHDAVATPERWNQQIPTGATVFFGWTALAAATEVPTDITVNGKPC